MTEKGKLVIDNSDKIFDDIKCPVCSRIIPFGVYMMAVKGYTLWCQKGCGARLKYHQGTLWVIGFK